MMQSSEIKSEKVQPSENLLSRKPGFKDTAKARIELKTCSKNYNCVVFCPRNAITINEKGQPIVDYDLCDGCFICLRECPSSAISEVKK